MSTEPLGGCGERSVKLLAPGSNTYTRSGFDQNEVPSSTVLPATHKILPQGSKTPGASIAVCRLPFGLLKLLVLVSTGKSGPAVQVPGSAAFAGGVYKPVWPVAPTANRRPSGSTKAGPISEIDLDTGGFTVVSTRLMRASTCGGADADTHVSVAGIYFSALEVPLMFTVTTLPSGNRVQVSSLVSPCFVCVPPVTKPTPDSRQSSVTGSQRTFRLSVKGTENDPSVGED